MKVKTYNDDDLRDTDYRDGSYPWEFIADVPGDNPDILDCDNNELAHKLEAFGAIMDCDEPDTEMCCFYIYFPNKNAGRRFIKKLNEYLLEKARLIEEARSF